MSLMYPKIEMEKKLSPRKKSFFLIKILKGIKIKPSPYSTLKFWALDHFLSPLSITPIYMQLETYFEFFLFSPK